MSSALLDLTDRIDPFTRLVLLSVANAAASLALQYFVIGATARDLVLHLHYGAELDRATRDLDFAVQVANWGDFDALKSELLKSGFHAAARPHRLTLENGGWIDLVPFGDIAPDGKPIAWPPDGEVVMTVLGFDEAFTESIEIRIQQAPEATIKVVSPVGFALLKWMAWTEREQENRIKDAMDLLYLCRTYREIPEVTDAMYGDSQMMEGYEWDQDLGSAHVLGRHVKQMASLQTQQHLREHFGPEFSGATMERLARESCERARLDHQFPRHQALLKAFTNGYING